MKVQEIATVISCERLADGIYSTVLRAPEIVKTALPGQFVCVYCDDKAHLLPRFSAWFTGWWASEPTSSPERARELRFVS